MTLEQRFRLVQDEAPFPWTRALRLLKPEGIYRLLKGRAIRAKR